MPEETKTVAVAERPVETIETDLSAFANVEIEPSALPLLTGTRKRLAAKIVEILLDAAKRHNIKTCMTLSTGRDRDLDLTYLGITQIVFSSEKDYLAYWDKLDGYVQTWVDSLTETEEDYKVLESEIHFWADRDMNEPA